MVLGTGSTTETVTAEAAQRLIAQALEPCRWMASACWSSSPMARVPCPCRSLFRLLYEELGPRVARLDYLIALGTHQPMTDEAIDRLVGVGAAERAERYPKTQIFNHRWDEPAALRTIGVISRQEAAALTDGLLVDEVPVTLNRLIFEYDQLMICGPVFPHEVAGFSGGAKYLFPGIAGPDIINFTHWLGALVTSMHTIGVKDTPVRRVIHRAAELVNRPLLCLALVMQGDVLAWPLYWRASLRHSRRRLICRVS